MDYILFLPFTAHSLSPLYQLPWLAVPSPLGQQQQLQGGLQ